MIPTQIVVIIWYNAGTFVHGSYWSPKRLATLFRCQVQSFTIQHFRTLVSVTNDLPSVNRQFSPFHLLRFDKDLRLLSAPTDKKKERSLTRKLQKFQPILPPPSFSPSNKKIVIELRKREICMIKQSVMGTTWQSDELIPRPPPFASFSLEFPSLSFFLSSLFLFSSNLLHFVSSCDWWKTFICAPPCDW